MYRMIIFCFLVPWNRGKIFPSLLRAFKILTERYPDLNLVIAGQKGWKYEEIFLVIEELKINDKVIFLGYVAEEDIPVLYSSAIGFVFPSLYEGFGMPPLEAMACGTPVIVSNTSSLPEVVGDAGIMVSPLDVEHIAYEMERLLNDQSLRKQKSDQGLTQSQKFSWEESARKVVNLYNIL